MIYRNNFYGDYTEGNEKKVYSANMLRIRGNPKLYGFTCESYPDNCNINKNDLNKDIIDKILPLNMYYINKRLNAEGNTKINENGEAVYEQRKQYMSIVSCESEETDPNKGECKYTIEINNERDEIQLMPETVFATSIFGQINYFMIRLKDFQNTGYLKLHFTVLTGNAELYIYDDWLCNHEVTNYKISHIHRKEIIEINQNLKENYYIIVKCSEPSFIQLKYETDAHYKGYNNLMPNELNIEPINKYVSSYYNMYNPNYYYPFDNENSNKNKDLYYRLETLDCSMYLGDVGVNFSDINVSEAIKPKNQLYSYLTTYGFIGQVDKFKYTSLDNGTCGLVIYNGEQSENRPLLITSDMPHKSNFNQTYYVFPFLYDKDNDQGILFEFNLYNTKDAPSGDLYEINCRIGNDQMFDQKISANTVKYIDKQNYGNLFQNNIFGNVYISLRKIHTDKDYYITTNVISSKISPEIVQLNQDYAFKLRPSSSKYFYSPINKDSLGHIKFNNLPKNVDVYSKIVEKNAVEQDYNWNKRVKLPEENDKNLLSISNGLIKFDKSQTSKCNAGCELYFHIKSKATTNELKISETDLISIEFIFKDSEYKGGDDEDGGGSSVWVIVVVVIIVLALAIIILVFIMRKKRIKSSDIDNMNTKDINELSMPLE